MAVVSDLMTQSRILATARHAGRAVTFVSSENEIDRPYQLALVDLEARVDVAAMIAALGRAGAIVVAFGPHLDTPRLKAARAAGADRVLARSKFVMELPRLLGGAPPEAGSVSR